MQNNRRFVVLSFTIVLLGSMIFLSGCLSRSDRFKETMAEQGIKPMTGEEIKGIISDNTMYSVAPNNNGEDAVYIRNDGTLVGMAWGGGKTNSDNGEWFINDQGRYCEKYLGQWAGGVRCFSVYPGDNSSNIIMILETGVQSRVYLDGIYDYTIYAGNKYNL